MQLPIETLLGQKQAEFSYEGIIRCQSTMFNFVLDYLLFLSLSYTNVYICMYNNNNNNDYFADNFQLIC